MKHLVKFLTVAEIAVDSDIYDLVAEAQAVLDAFREATLPSTNYGVALYRATPDDLTGELSRRQVDVIPLPGSDWRRS